MSPSLLQSRGDQRGRRSLGYNPVHSSHPGRCNTRLDTGHAHRSSRRPDDKDCWGRRYSSHFSKDQHQLQRIWVVSVLTYDSS